MLKIENLSDKAAISLSLLCAIHCLAMPTLVILLPSIAALSLEGEAFHLWMFLAVLPTSLLALSMGCRKHRRYHIFAWVSLGLMILGICALFGHELFGEIGEKLMTIVGASIIALGHFRNHRLCQQQDCLCEAG